ncbi:MAG: thermonuclease family protein [Deltaproteobacteria bacterium]|nr:thermonuclease family protein [Deltaproteobacteria bacterium]MBW1928248.1 thermonuclease family protein [Deltaproteobacteria bacterium]
MGTLCLALVLLAISSVSAGGYKVVKVCDGDTIAVQKGAVTMTVDLAGIDAPELGSNPLTPGQPYAQEALYFLKKRLLNKQVALVIHNKIPEEPLAATILLNGRSINVEMVRQGLAEVCFDQRLRGLGVDGLLRAQKEARSAGLGIWSLGDDYVRPKAWRQKTRERCAWATLLYILVKERKK